METLKDELQIGDKIRRYEVVREIDYTYEITSVIKTLAKTSIGHSFYRKLDYNTTKPMPHYVAEIRKKDSYSGSHRYFLINQNQTP